MPKTDDVHENGSGKAAHPLDGVQSHPRLVNRDDLVLIRILDRSGAFLMDYMSGALLYEESLKLSLYYHGLNT